MAETTTTGFIEDIRPRGPLRISGTFRCPCGGYRRGTYAAWKGSKETWKCNRCKKEVVVFVPV